MNVRPAKTQISLGIRPVWSESSLCTQWVAKDPSFLHADSEDSDQTGWMPRLIWVFARRTAILLVLSCRASNVYIHQQIVWVNWIKHRLPIKIKHTCRLPIKQPMFDPIYSHYFVCVTLCLVLSSSYGVRSKSDSQTLEGSWFGKVNPLRDENFLETSFHPRSQ